MACDQKRNGGLPCSRGVWPSGREPIEAADLGRSNSEMECLDVVNSSTTEGRDTPNDSWFENDGDSDTRFIFRSNKVRESIGASDAPMTERRNIPLDPWFESDQVSETSIDSVDPVFVGQAHS